MRSRRWAYGVVATLLLITLLGLTTNRAPTPAQPCVIVFASGQKLCGDGARAWCDTTEAVRTADVDYESRLDPCADLDER